MIFSISREHVLKPLQMVMGAVEKRQNLPILSNTFVKVENGTLTFIATDLEIELHGEVSISGIEEEGHVTVPARKLLDICRALPEGGTVKFSQQGDNLHITCEKSRFKLATLPADEFPNIEQSTDKDSFSVPQKALRQLIEGVYFSIAQQDVRYYLNGMFFSKSTTGLRAVSTDGHRLSLANFEVELPGEVYTSIVPRKGVSELLRLLDDSDELITINIGEGHIRVSGDGYVFLSKLIDGVFPDYQKTIPKNADKQILIDRDMLKTVLARIAILSNEKYHGVKLSFSDNKMTIETHNSEHEEAFEELSIDYQGDPIDIGFNVSYLLDVLNSLPKGNVRLSLIDNQHSVQIESEESPAFLYVIMPMRI